MQFSKDFIQSKLERKRIFGLNGIVFLSINSTVYEYVLYYFYIYWYIYVYIHIYLPHRAQVMTTF